MKLINNNSVQDINTSFLALDKDIDRKINEVQSKMEKQIKEKQNDSESGSVDSKELDEIRSDVDRNEANIANVESKVDGKQNKLTAGTNIKIEGETISCTIEDLSDLNNDVGFVTETNVKSQIDNSVDPILNVIPSEASSTNQLADKAYVDSKEVKIDVDDKLSTTSENPVQNKVITNKINSLTSSDIKLSSLSQGITVFDSLRNAQDSAYGSFNFSVGGKTYRVASIMSTFLGTMSPYVYELNYSDCYVFSNGKWVSSSAPDTYNVLVGMTPIMQCVIADSFITWKTKGTYSKPSDGIPKTDLDSAVQESLSKADTALQSHQDISGKLNVDGSNATNTGTSKIVHSLDTATGDVTDNTEFITSSNTGYSASDTKYYRRTGLRIWNYIKSKISSVLGITDTKGCVKNYYVVNLESYANTLFFPLVWSYNDNMLDIEVQSNNLGGASPYNQNTLHIFVRTAGWSDTPPSFQILEYGEYASAERTIMGISRGLQSGTFGIWVRGGLTYRIKCNRDFRTVTSSYTEGTETWTGNTTSWGTGTNVILWKDFSAYVNSNAPVSAFSSPIYGTFKGKADTAGSADTATTAYKIRTTAPANPQPGDIWIS